MSFLCPLAKQLKKNPWLMRYSSAGRNMEDSEKKEGNTNREGTDV